MFLKCIKLYYIKDNSVANSIDFIKKKDILVSNCIAKKYNDLKRVKSKQSGAAACNEKYSLTVDCDLSVYLHVSYTP